MKSKKSSTSQSEPANLTNSLVKLASYQLDKKLEAEYERGFPHIGAPPAFFDRLDLVDTKLTEALAKRPLTRAEITSLGDRAFKSLRTSMLKHAKTITQPKFQELVHIQTGKTRLIPRVD